MEESNGELDTGIRDVGVGHSVLDDRAGVDIDRLVARGEALDGNEEQTGMAVSEVWSSELAVIGEMHPVRHAEEPLSVTPTPADAAEPAPVLPEPDVEPEYPDTPIEEIICGLPWDCGTAIAIAHCESTLRPDAVGNGSYGLFQIQASVHAWKWTDFWQAWSDPVRNAEYAWEIYQGRGWYAWSCF